jgi:single-strand DNA-binding protein
MTMASLNKVVLMGNLTRDPEMRYTPSGTPVASFGLAVNRRYRQGEETKEDVCFVDVTVFGRPAEIASEYLSKGRLVFLEGRLRWHSWEAEGGQKRSKLDVVAEALHLMPRSREDGAERPSMRSPRAQEDFESPLEDDDIPFVRSDLSDEHLGFQNRWLPRA